MIICGVYDFDYLFEEIDKVILHMHTLKLQLKFLINFTSLWELIISENASFNSLDLGSNELNLSKSLLNFKSQIPPIVIVIMVLIY